VDGAVPYSAMLAGFEKFAGLDAARLKRGAPGWLTSLLLHGLLLLGALMVLNRPPPGQQGLRFVPVTLVPFGGQSDAPRAGANAAPVPARAPSLPARRAAAVAASPAGASKTYAAPDALDAELARLSKARLPQTGSLAAAPDFAAAEPGDRGTGEGEEGAYGVRDLVRAQVLRRWSLDLAILGAQRFTVPVRVLMRRDGTVLRAEVVESPRFHTDKIYREIALSARNAVILSSPLALPAGNYAPVFAVTILLDPRDTLH